VESFRPGFNIHFIQARKAAESPWGWRDGVVRAYADRVVVIDYLEEHGWIELWHHRQIALRPGDPVRVHERFHVLDICGVWVSYGRRQGGLGAVPKPTHPQLWAREAPAVITDLAAGRAHVDSASEPLE